MTTAFCALPTLEAPGGASQLPGSTYEAPCLEFGPLCGLPSPLECVAALEHAHRLVPGYPCDKLSLSHGRPRRRTTALKRLSTRMHCRAHAAIMFSESLTSSDLPACVRLYRLALNSAINQAIAVDSRSDGLATWEPRTGALSMLGRAIDAMGSFGHGMQLRVRNGMNYLSQSANRPRVSINSDSSLEVFTPRACRIDGASAGRLAIAYYLLFLADAAEAAGGGESQSWLRDMPKFSGRMRDYFTWDWNWTSWLGARNPELHVYLMGAAIALPVVLTMTDALQIVMDRMADVDFAMRAFAPVPIAATGGAAAPAAAAASGSTVATRRLHLRLRQVSLPRAASLPSTSASSAT